MCVCYYYVIIMIRDSSRCHILVVVLVVVVVVVEVGEWRVVAVSKSLCNFISSLNFFWFNFNYL